jgi:hypothetical protein
MNLAQIKTDFKASFTPGKILAVLVIAIVIVPLAVFLIRKTPAKAALDAIPGKGA